jgi:hypothetical protein
VIEVKTKNGQWVVTAQWYGEERVVFTPDPDDHVLVQIRACVRFKEENS